MEQFESVDDGNRFYEEFMQHPTTAPDIGVDLKGFASKEQAERVGTAVNTIIQLSGRFFDLRRLKQVIVAWDYNETLAGLERGSPVSKPLKATRDELGVGIAMAPTILDEGEPRSVIVLNALQMNVFAAPERPDLDDFRKEMVYTIIHECAHVHDLEMKDRCLPGIIMRMPLAPRDGILFGFADACWSEYIACRLSAPFAGDSTLRGYGEVFCKSLESANRAANAAIRQYRLHRDVERLLEEAAGAYKRLLTYGAYLIGHLDGIDRNLGEAVPEAADAIDQSVWFKPCFDSLRTELQAMYADYGCWRGMEAYEPLKRIAYDLLNDRGIDVQAPSNGGCYINVPLSPETIPSLAEQAHFHSSSRSDAS